MRGVGRFCTVGLKNECKVLEILSATGLVLSQHGFSRMSTLLWNSF